MALRTQEVDALLLESEPGLQGDEEFEAEAII